MKINARDVGLDIYLETEADIDVVLGLIGEGPAQDDDRSIEFRDAIGAAKQTFVTLREQASLFDVGNKPETVRATASVPIQLEASGYDFPPSAVEWATDRSRIEVTAEWDAGYGAGWRGDELVTEKSPFYLFAYEQGQTGRQAYDERFSPEERGGLLG